MYEVFFKLLFGAGVLLTIGAWTDRGRGFSAGAGIFVWAVLGTSSFGLLVPDNGGGTTVQSSAAFAYLCFGNAAMHAIALVMHLHEVLVDSDEHAEQLDPTALNEDVDHGRIDALDDLNPLQ